MYRLPLRTAGIAVIKEAVADWEAAALQSMTGMPSVCGESPQGA